MAVCPAMNSFWACGCSEAVLAAWREHVTIQKILRVKVPQVQLRWSRAAVKEILSLWHSAVEGIRLLQMAVISPPHELFR
eukprot:3119277-Rhodomonas_salina.2